MNKIELVNLISKATTLTELIDIQNLIDTLKFEEKDKEYLKNLLHTKHSIISGAIDTEKINNEKYKGGLPYVNPEFNAGEVIREMLNSEDVKIIFEQ